MQIYKYLYVRIGCSICICLCVNTVDIYTGNIASKLELLRLAYMERRR